MGEEASKGVAEYVVCRERHTSANPCQILSRIPCLSVHLSLSPSPLFFPLFLFSLFSLSFSLFFSSHIQLSQLNLTHLVCCLISVSSSVSSEARSTWLGHLPVTVLLCPSTCHSNSAIWTNTTYRQTISRRRRKRTTRKVTSIRQSMWQLGKLTLHLCTLDI